MESKVCHWIISPFQLKKKQGSKYSGLLCTASKMASYLITGGSRGLGLAMVKVLLECSPKEVFQVIATVRKESPSLQKLMLENESRLFVIHLDVGDEDSIREAVRQVTDITGNGLDILINNAGVMNYAPTGVPQM
jgi:NAD(P)-dependent dehydrogenase (short-subunit alcohol dehydrogenase family)